MKAVVVRLLVFLFIPGLLSAPVPGQGSAAKPAVIRVPGDHPLISQAIRASRDGDVIEVADGFYFEKNVVIDKAVTLRSKNIYGAVIYGSDEAAEAIFLVRAACRIEGFVLKAARTGLLQRDSPDVGWEGRSLALFGMERAVAVDDRNHRWGAARLVDVVVVGCQCAFVTNDARSMDVSRVLAVNVGSVFVGSNHLSFTARDIVALNCRALTGEREGAKLPPPSSDRITLEPRIYAFNSEGRSPNGESLPRVLNRIFQVVANDPEYPDVQARRREALLLLVIGDLFYLNGNMSAAADHYLRAQKTDPAKPGGDVTWRTLLGLASVAEAQDHYSDAVAYLMKAVEITERIGATIPVQAFQRGFRGDKIGIYENLIGHLIDLHRAEPGGGYGRDALWYAEKSRARGFMIGLTLLNPAAESSDLKALRSRSKERSRDVSRFQIALQDPDLPAEKRNELLDRLERTERDRSAQILDMRRRDLESGRFQFPEPFRAEDIRARLLGPGTGLLEYVLGERNSYAFLLTADGLDTAVLPPADELRPLVSRYLQFLTLRETGEFRGWEGGRILTRILLDPFRARLASGIKSLVIVPDGALHYLPFETLLSPLGGKERFLVEDLEIAYGPSASGLIRLAERPAPTAFPKDFLGFANTRARVVFGFSEKTRIPFFELPFGVKEIRAIRDQFPRSRTRAVWGDEAREDVFKSLPLFEFRIIHLVAHGFYDDRNWQRSALLLQPDGNGLEDGFLQANDIYELKLRPELLVLSGCQTGTGYLQKGEGLTGLASAFFYAGARSILMSLWNINDKAASVFMASFYRHFTAGRGKAASLRQAKLDMLKSSFRHPYYWAPFILQGQ